MCDPNPNPTPRKELECGQTRILTAAFDGSWAAQREATLRCNGRHPFSMGSPVTDGGSWFRRNVLGPFTAPPDAILLPAA